MNHPTFVIEMIFTKLLLIYGRSFTDKWSGMDIELIKADWAYELAGLLALPDSIAYALQNIDPSKPPTAREFRALAYRCPPKRQLAIDRPKADPQKIADALLRESRKRTPPLKGTDWARKVMARYRRGESISPYALKMAKEVLDAEKLLSDTS